MDQQLIKRLSGLGLLVGVALLTLVFQQFGAAEQPTTYTIGFDRGTKLDDGAKATLNRALEDALVRNDATIVITGHTGTLGDPEANNRLSEQRAQTVASQLTGSGVDNERIKTLGMGGTDPLPRQADESDRAYQRRLPRTEVTIAP